MPYLVFRNVGAQIGRGRDVGRAWVARFSYSQNWASFGVSQRKHCKIKGMFLGQSHEIGLDKPRHFSRSLSGVLFAPDGTTKVDGGCTIDGG